MNKYLVFLIIILKFTNCFSQKTELLYLDSNNKRTDKNKATMVLKSVFMNNHYYLSDYDKSGSKLFYCECSSINPMIKDGLSEYYKKGVLYSKGNYFKNNLTGKWIYYKTEKNDTIDYTIVESYLKSISDSTKKTVIRTKKRIDSNIVHPIIKNLVNYMNKNGHNPFLKTAKYANVSLVIDNLGYIKYPKLESPNNDFVYELQRLLLSYKYENAIKKPIKLPITDIYFNDKDSIVLSECATFQKQGLDNFRNYIQKRLIYPYDGEFPIT